MSKIRLYGSTSGYVELAAPAVSDDGVLVLPTASAGFGPAGIGSNAVQALKTDTFATNSSTLVDVPGLSATITPTSAESKILVITSVAATNSIQSSSNPVSAAALALFRNSTQIDMPFDYGSRTPTLSLMGTDDNHLFRSTNVFLDSPNSIEPQVYNVKVACIWAGTARINHGNADFYNDYTNPRTTSTLTLIEVS